MGGYVCTVAGGKGGVGKTTTAVNLAVALQGVGRDVVVVDADLGMANVGPALGVDAETSLHDVLAGEANVSEALADGPSGLTVVPGDARLGSYADADPAGLRGVVDTLRTAFDVVIVDTGAGLSHEVAVPLGLADGVVLVATPDDVAVDDTRKSAMLAERLDGNVLGVVVTRSTRPTDAAEVVERLGFDCLAAVPDDPEAAGEEPLVVHAPDSPCAVAYRELGAALDGVFSGEQTVADVEPAVEREWFGEEEEEEGEQPETDDEEESGVFGLFG